MLGTGLAQEGAARASTVEEPLMERGGSADAVERLAMVAIKRIDSFIVDYFDVSFEMKKKVTLN